MKPVMYLNLPSTMSLGRSTRITGGSMPGLGAPHCSDDKEAWRLCFSNFPWMVTNSNRWLWMYLSLCVFCLQLAQCHSGRASKPCCALLWGKHNPQPWGKAATSSAAPACCQSCTTPARLQTVTETLVCSGTESSMCYFLLCNFNEGENN